MNHYEVLGVPMGADPAEIRRAYLKLARRHHPDMHLGDPPGVQAEARQKMLDVNAAWAVLGDPERRAGYDRSVRAGRADPTSARPSPTRGWTPLADDTRWMTDFAGWRDETDRLPEDDELSVAQPPPGLRPAARSSPLAVLPVAVFALSVLAGCISVVLQSRAVFALAFVGAACSALLFFVLPMLAMTRSKHDGDD